MAKIRPITNPHVLPKNINGQVAKIGEEFQEFIEAWLGGDPKGADEEAMDIMIACRTYFYRRGYDDEKVDQLYNEVELKNTKRDYYKR